MHTQLPEDFVQDLTFLTALIDYCRRRYGFSGYPTWEERYARAREIRHVYGDAELQRDMALWYGTIRLDSPTIEK